MGVLENLRTFFSQDVEGNVPSPHSTLVRDYSQQGSRWQRQVGVRLYWVSASGSTTASGMWKCVWGVCVCVAWDSPA